MPTAAQNVLVYLRKGSLMLLGHSQMPVKKHKP
jgi:hypothetical protein